MIISKLLLVANDLHDFDDRTNCKRFAPGLVSANPYATRKARDDVTSNFFGLDGSDSLLFFHNIRGNRYKMSHLRWVGARSTLILN